MPKLIAKHLFFENAPRTASTSLNQSVLTIVNNPVVGFKEFAKLMRLLSQSLVIQMATETSIS